MIDLAKGIKAFTGGIRKKELGFPVENFLYNNGIWVIAPDDYSTYIAKSYKKIPYVYSIISHIIDKASDAPIMIMREKKGRSSRKFDAAMSAGMGLHDLKVKSLKEQTFDEVDQHDFLNAIERPNSIDTEKTLKEAFLGYLLLTGNAYMYGAVPGVGVNASKPTELWVLPSPVVNILQGDKENPVGGYQAEYYINSRLEPWQVAHCKLFNPITYFDPAKYLYGLSPLHAARGVISQADASDFAQGMLYKNMGPKGLLAGDKEANYDDEQASMIRDRFKQNYMGMENAGDIIVTSANVRWQQIGVSPVDLNLIEADNNYLQKLSAIYRYPKELITGSENVASQGVSDKQLITKCVMPVLRRLDDCLTKWIRTLYKDDSLRVMSDTSYYPELREDMEKMANVGKTAYWLSSNEKRALMDYDDDPDPNMDKKLIPSGLRTLEDIAEPMEIDTDLLDQENVNDFDRQDQNDSGN